MERRAIRGRSGRPLCRASLCASQGRECRRLTWRWRVVAGKVGRECGERERERAGSRVVYIRLRERAVRKLWPR